MDRYTKLIKNTLIFAIGTFGTRILSFVIVPLYTYVLTTAEYGKIDLFVTAITMMQPIGCLMFSEAVIRFGTTKERSREEILTNSMLVFFYSILFAFAMIPLDFYAFKLGENLWLYVIVQILYGYVAIFAQYLRANGQSVAYALSSILQCCTMLGSNVVLLIMLRIGMRGYFYSMLLSNLVCSVFITIAGRIVQNLSFRKINWKLLKEMLHYSIPLIPNSMMWWIMSAGDKYIINYSLGDSANGIYSIALKVPTVLSLMYTIFVQAWQVSAIEEKNNSEIEAFYNTVFSASSFVLGLASSCVIIGIYPLFNFILNENFRSAWEYVPLLCIAMVVNGFSEFMGIVYTITKRSSRVLAATSIGAVVNILCNLALVGRFGLYGVAIGTIVGYLVVLFLRMQDMKKYMHITLKVRRFYLTLLVLFLEAVIVIHTQRVAGYLVILAMMAAMVLLYRKELAAIVQLLKGKLPVK